MLATQFPRGSDNGEKLGENEPNFRFVNKKGLVVQLRVADAAIKKDTLLCERNCLMMTELAIKWIIYNWIFVLWWSMKQKSEANRIESEEREIFMMDF